MNTTVDCIGTSTREACKMLLVPKCLGVNCPFRKTNAQAAHARRKTFARLRTLSPAVQVAIADKYYGSKLMWHKERSDEDDG